MLQYLRQDSWGEADLPKRLADLGEPKYKGKFYTAPWTTGPIFGVLVYSKEEWLEIMRGWGQNKVTTIRSRGGVDRMMLGEFAFEPFSNEHYYFELKEKGDPAGMAVFKDLVPLTYLFHITRKNARHPNAGKLFALWATGPEATQIFEKYSWTGNIAAKASKVGSGVLEEVAKIGAKLVSWFDSKENLSKLEWFGTKEGEAYEEKIALALKVK